ncbi:MAG: hypothetical protein FWD45_04640, partial [Coriobacteriia bacterium]|nr:hypothetical protein [Coriobacteriia bacterium]
MIFDRQALKFNSQLLVIMALLGSVGTLLCALAGHQDFIPQQLVSSLGMFLIGLVRAWTNVAAFRIYHSNGTIWGLVILMIVVTASSNLQTSLMFTYLPESVQALMAVLAIPAFAMLLWYLQRKLSFKNPVALPRFRKSMNDALDQLKKSQAIRSQVLILFLLAFAVILFRTVNPGGLWGGAYLESTPATGFMAALLAILVFAPIACVSFWGYAHKS